MEKYFIDVSIIVNGALDSEERFDSPSDGIEYIETEKDVLRKLYKEGDIEDAAIYTITHHHDVGNPCECIQYETSHAPDWSIGIR